MPKHKKRSRRFFGLVGTSDIEFLVMLFFVLLIGLAAAGAFAGKIQNPLSQSTAQPTPKPLKETIVLTLTLQKGTSWTPITKWQLTNGLNWRGIESDVKDMEGAGIKWVRLALTEHNETNDRLIKLLTDHDIQPLLVIVGNPSDQKGNLIQRKFYTDRVKTLAKRYIDKVSYFEIGIEPNNPAFWKIDTAESSDPKKYEQSVADYISRLKDAYTSIKKENPQAFVSIGGIAEDKMERWLTIFMNLEGYKYMDIMAFHPKASSPEMVVQQVQRLKVKISEVPDLATKPIWITDVGYTTDKAEDEARYVADEAIKADSLTRTYNEIRNNNVYGPIFWHGFVGPEPTKSGFGLIIKDNTTLNTTYLPAYEAIKSLH